MREKEFRLGNWIKYNGFNRQIVSLNLGTEINAEPIILTEDILIKIGFKWNEAWGSYILNGFMVEKLGELLCERKYGICVKSVSQLQNLYYFIVGKELDFIL